ncbi:DUF4381 domain-containing protein [Brucella thiophenivorans]|uniref:DUF4381 domain-containing protein n=1 Tax=Brucella thiophenivorans TaxID=571255 RepID=A0A256FIX0_9HYPH|nr:DUF4381 domain-containing protein [Brucella thiophenivorans]OYR14794.1 hypothetical protein CEV31_3169 [Brucella thiophenivorans]
MEPPAPILDPMAETALRSLKDIVVPPPISWMPQTWGWAVLGLILLAGILIVLLKAAQHYRANAYRREALSILSEIGNRLDDPRTRMAALAEISALVKRTAMVAWPRHDVADLTGKTWAEFLAAHSPTNSGHLLEKLVNDIEYRNEEFVSRLPSKLNSELIKATRNWIEQHNVSA